MTPSEIIIENNDEDGLGGTLSVNNGCMNDVSVELYCLDGLGHQWPSIKRTRVFDIDSTSVIWEFFFKYDVDGSME
jgi:poly(3-hydroxybutyrate) depolymerase